MREALLDGMRTLALAGVVAVVLPAPSFAADAPALSACVGCHGASGRGDAATGAPNIGGMDGWYVERQLRNFIRGVRGADPHEPYGLRMRSAIVSLVAPEQAHAVAEQVATWPRSAPAAPAFAAKANLVNGRNYFNAICSACHNANGMGSAALGAPRLAGVDPNYLLRQMAGFRSGTRGTHPEDTAGAQMRRITTALPDAAADRDVIAFVSGLAVAAPAR